MLAQPRQLLPLAHFHESRHAHDPGLELLELARDELEPPLRK